ncbi:MAG: lysoplasmalogenase [Gammaproteobacteria bacterium]|nr:lysoplasmalogenase [Gammaproteobacteria bacterium]
MTVTITVTFTVFFVLTLLLGHWRQISWVIGSSKVAASTCLIILAVIFATESSSFYSIAILCGVSLGAFGDVAMLSKRKSASIVAMALFGIGHLAYLFAFSQLEINVTQSIICFGVLLIVFRQIYQWLSNDLSSSLRIGVIGYSVVLLLVCAVALSTRINGYPALVGLAATLFMLSDFFVASYRFKRPKLSDKVIGLPLYYTAQLFYIYSIEQNDLNWLMI